MPYFPNDEDNVFTVTLRGGSTISLTERRYTVGDRQRVTKRGLLLQHEMKQKTKGTDEFDKVLENDDSANEEYEAAVDKLTALQGDVMRSYAEVIVMRFSAWDYYATKADFEAGNPVPLEVEEIVNRCEMVIIEQIIQALQPKDAEREKKELIVVDVGGSSSTATEAS